MESSFCPLCDKRINNWELASGKVILINNKDCHVRCTLDLTPSQIDHKIRTTK